MRASLSFADLKGLWSTGQHLSKVRTSSPHRKVNDDGNDTSEHKHVTDYEEAEAMSSTCSSLQTSMQAIHTTQNASHMPHRDG
jgi:hypothetical protein